MQNRFFEINFRKSLIAVMLISSLCLGCGTFVYASNYAPRILPDPGDKQSSCRVLPMGGGPSAAFMLAEAEAVISLLEKEKSSLKEQLLQTQDGLQKTEARLTAQLAVLTKAKPELEVKLSLLEEEKSSLIKQLSVLGNIKLDCENKLKTDLSGLREEKFSLKEQLVALTRDKEEASFKASLLEKEKYSLKKEQSLLEKKTKENEVGLNDQLAVLIKSKQEDRLQLLKRTNKLSR